MGDRKNLVALGPDEHADAADEAAESTDFAAGVETPSEEYPVVGDEWPEVKVKNMRNGDQELVAVELLASRLAELF